MRSAGRVRARAAANQKSGRGRHGSSACFPCDHRARRDRDRRHRSRTGDPVALARRPTGAVWRRNVAGPPAVRFVLLAGDRRRRRASADGDRPHRRWRACKASSRGSSRNGCCRPTLRAPHPRFGTPWRVIDATAVLQIAIVLVSAGQPGWLVTAYAVGLSWSAAFKIAALIRFRSLRRAPRAFQVPFNLTIAGRVWPIGLWLTGLWSSALASRFWRCPTPARSPAVSWCWRLASALLAGARGAAHTVAAVAARPVRACFPPTTSICSRWMRGRAICSCRSENRTS